jgi:hypothetical protein
MTIYKARELKLAIDEIEQCIAESDGDPKVNADWWLAKIDEYKRALRTGEWPLQRERMIDNGRT